MTEPDLFADWRPIGDLRADRPADPQPEPAADKRIQRLQARSAEKRADRHDAIETWTQKRRAARDDRRDARAEQRDLREQKRIERNQRADRAKTRAASIARLALVTGPIIAPMAVAWTGQSHFATSVLGWIFEASIVYAAAYELTTAYWAWLYHEARSDGDSGWEYRLATWVFATGAAVQQWWHYSNHWHATPRAVTYSAMSAIGVLLWEGYARLIHRRKLRAEGKLAPARPRIGLARWVRYPVRSWTAWSLITLEGHRTLDAAWVAADAVLRATEVAKANRPAKTKGWRTSRASEPMNLGPVNHQGRNRPSLGGVREPAAELTSRPTPEPVGKSQPVAAEPVPEPLNQEPRHRQEPASQAPRTSGTANLTDRAANKAAQTEQVLNLIDELGYNAVTLAVVRKETGMSKTTAHHRLKEARELWNQRAA